MKKFHCLLVLIMLSIMLSAQEIPQKISYQGKLLDSGVPVNGTKNITFTIGSWTETQSVQISEGLYSVTLGSVTPIPSSLFDDNSSLELEIEIDGTTLAPNTDILSSPYAFKAEKAVDAEKIAGSTVSTNTPTFDQILKWNGSSWTPDTDLTGPSYTSGTGINISGSTINAQNTTSLWDANKLQGHSIPTSLPLNGQILKGNGSQWTLQNDGLSLPYNDTSDQVYTSFMITNTGNGDIAKFVIDNPASNGEALTLTTNSSGRAVYINNNGTNDGIYIHNDSYPNISGGFALHINNQNNTDVVHIEQHGAAGTALQVTTVADNDCAAFLVQSGGGDAIYANTYNGTGYAGNFQGNVNITGTLTGGKSYTKIDHPLDPENKYLIHSTVESPDMMNIYNGNVIIDNNGEALVKLPDWFEALNMEFRYQLTCMGGYANIFIAEEISDNTFKIAGGTPGLKVSWQVTGIRQDPFAIQNRIQVEVDKSDKEKGHYLHYQEYNQPIEKSIEVVKNPELLEESRKSKK